MKVLNEIQLNQILEEEKNKLYYAKVNNAFNLEGPALIVVNLIEFEVYFIVNYENGKIQGDGFFFSSHAIFNSLLVHFTNNTIDHIYHCNIDQCSIYDENEGSRWEGNVCTMKDNEHVFFPFGEGCEYNEENELVFEGLRFGVQFNGFGRCFWGGLRKSEGYFIHDKEYGKKVEYDRKGRMVNRCVAVEGKNCIYEDEKCTFTSDCTLTTCMFSFPSSILSLPHTIDFQQFHYLEELIIPSALHSSCHTIIFKNMPNLEKIELGDACFSKDSIQIPPYTPGQYQTICQQNKRFVISSCSKLTSVSFGALACSDFHSLTIENLPQLNNITFGTNDEESYCFYSTDVLRITNTPHLERVVVGGHSFYWCSKVELSNAQCLQVHCGESAFERCTEFHYREDVKLFYQYPSFGTMHSSV